MPLRVTRRNVQGGMMTAHGFVPFRSSSDYDPELAGDDYGARTDNTGFKRYARTKVKTKAKVARKRKAAPRKAARKTKGKAKATTRKRNPTTWGTSYFVSKAAAVRYYRLQGEDAADVERKLQEGLIHIGKPTVKANQRLSLIDGGKRYAITEGVRNPRRRSASMLRPARGKESPRVRAALAKYVRGKNPVEFLNESQARALGFKAGEASKQHDVARSRHFKTQFNRARALEPKAKHPALDAAYSEGYTDGAGGGFRNPRRNPSKITYRFVDEGGGYGHFISSRKRPGKGKIVSLPRGYVKGADGVYRYSKSKSNPRKRNAYFPGGGASDLLHKAFTEGKRYRTSGDYYTSGVANARVVSYGFNKWLPWDKVPRGIGTTKARLLAAFREGYNVGKRLESKKNPGWGKQSRERKRGPWFGIKTRKEKRALHHFKDEARYRYARQSSRDREDAKANPHAGGSKVYEVRIPRTSYDTGYTLTIRAKTKRTAKAEAKSYCAESYSQKTGNTKASYRLPSTTKVTEVKA